MLIRLGVRRGHHLDFSPVDASDGSELMRAGFTSVAREAVREAAAEYCALAPSLEAPGARLDSIEDAASLQHAFTSVARTDGLAPLLGGLLSANGHTGNGSILRLSMPVAACIALLGG